MTSCSGRFISCNDTFMILQRCNFEVLPNPSDSAKDYACNNETVSEAFKKVVIVDHAS